MRASATFRPIILLYNLHQLTHELIHVADVEKSATRYVAALEQTEFASAEACEQAVIEAKSGFGDRMREFAWQSNIEHHPQLLAGVRRTR